MNIKRANSSFPNIGVSFSVFWKLANATGMSTRNSLANEYPCSKIRNASGGFTLVELLVSISIFVLVTVVAVYNNNQFNSSVLLTNLSYEVALSVRQAQSYGISIKSKSGVSTFDVFNSGFGVHFGSNSTQYTLFEDKAASASDPNSISNSVFDSGESLEVYNLRKGNKIGKICLGTNSSCTNSSSVDISFRRPNPDAYIVSGSTSYSKAQICVVSASGTKRKVVIEVTGQISVVADDTTICN